MTASSPSTRLVRVLQLLILAAVIATSAIGGSAGATMAEERFFPETGYTVREPFLAYWDTHGGLAQQGYPLSNTFTELSPVDGKPYTVQYFERARFEYHPEQDNPQFQVLLGQLGREQFAARYPGGRPPTNLEGRSDDCFVTTQRCIGEPFLTYWRAHGGLAQHGLPISDEFEEISALDGKPYTVQYFERARFEYHPENVGTPYEILLGQLGREWAAARYPQGTPWGPTLVPLTGGATFTAADGQFSVNYPYGWVSEEVFDARSMALYPPQEKYVFCSVSITHVPSRTLGEAVIEVEESIAFDLQHNPKMQIEVLAKEPIIIGTRPAYRYLLTHTHEGVRLQEARVAYVTGEYQVRANCYAPIERYAAWSATFEGIIGSVTLRRVADRNLPMMARTEHNGR